MSIPIFWRLILGYFAVLFLSVAVSSYSIVQLSGLSGTARAALDVDNRMIAYGETLTDAFLSEVRYAGRFLITHSKALHDQFRQFKGDFVRYMSELNALATSAEVKLRLSRVEELHARYQDLFEREVRYVQARQPYAESRYQQEREKVLESTLGELDRLKAQLKKNLNEKLASMEQAARRTRSIAAVTTVILLGLGIALSLVTSKSITKPLSELSRRAANPRRDPAAPGLDFYRIPEIQAVADALSNAQRRLDEAAKANAAFVNSITEQLGTPLISLNKRLSYLGDELAERMSPEQRTTFAVMAEETDRLIRHCTKLQPSEPQLEPEALKAPTVRGETAGGSLVTEVLDWRSHWRGFLNRVERAARPISESACSLVAGSWKTILHSIKTLAYGKAEKQ